MTLCFMGISRHTMFQFGKAQASSLVSTAVDFSVAALVFKGLDCNYLFSTIAGSVSGGATNCVINYCWTFRGSKRKKFYILCRYVFVWFGSLILNTLLTSLLVNLLSDVPNQFLGRFMIAKAISAIIVAFTWNFMMQKKFVY